MRILLVADDSTDASTVEAALTDEGHEVVSCRDDLGGPCRGIDDVAACPLERHVDLAVVARPGDAPRSLHEVGAVCAARRRIGVFEVDTSDHLGECAAEMHRRAERAVCHAYEQAVLADLDTAGFENVFVHVTRRAGVVRIVVAVDPLTRAGLDGLAIARLVDRVGRAARRHDRFAPTMDVIVESW